MGVLSVSRAFFFRAYWNLLALAGLRRALVQGLIGMSMALQPLLEAPLIDPFAGNSPGGGYECQWGSLWLIRAY